MTRHASTCLYLIFITSLSTFPNFTLAQSVTLASATLGTTGRVSGNTVTDYQMIAWRFSTDVPLAVHHVGGHMLSISPPAGDIFAAILRLDSITSLPHGGPFNDDEVIAHTTLHPNFPSDEYLTPLSATLLPGSYALMFGSTYFGTTGYAAFPNGFDQDDIPPTNLSSFIYWSPPRPGFPHEWRQNLASHMRFLVQADVIHLPGDYNLNGTVDALDYTVWRNNLGDPTETNIANNGNGGNISNDDFTFWKSHYGDHAAEPGAGGLAGAIPEPTTLLMLIAGMTIFAFPRLRPRR